ncbi:MAG TPA: phosphoribosylglycinamide synthetase C domain-containing protein [Verrucomicrobiae bacterium]|nr:phosphoribosylglycinamide synthetase C domain-containing protein [Verrucomicrobiae bacterium]
MVFGIGAFAQSTLRILGENGANVFGYLTRKYGHFAPRQEARCYDHAEHPNPLPLLRKHKVDIVLPMSIDWAEKPWARQLIDSGVAVFCPTAEALKIEKERDLARALCGEFGIPFPKAYWARNLVDAERILKRDPRPYVIKNPICGPFSPIHTIVCETAGDTRAWLPRLDYKDGVFLQEYLGRAEAGHIAVVSAGEIHSLVTNQEYKRAFDGNQGVVAGAPLGGLVEEDTADKYGLAKTLLRPLLSWFRRVNFHGPIQVTAIRHEKRWHVVEYNVRIGVTSGAMILRMLENPVEVIGRTARNEPLEKIRFKKAIPFGASVTLAGYGYPYTQLSGPEFPVSIEGVFDCDVWWNEARRAGDKLYATGHRIADVVAFGSSVDRAVRKSYENIRRIHCLASYYRTDIGASLWPPGNA